VRRFGGNVCGSSLADWKARSRLPTGYNCTFSLALTAEELIVKIGLWVGHFGTKY